MKLTKWFHEGVKPARPGVYETRLVGSSGYVIADGYSLWTGKRWNDTKITPFTASLDRSRGMQSKKWRGLAEKP